MIYILCKITLLHYITINISENIKQKIQYDFQHTQSLIERISKYNLKKDT